MTLADRFHPILEARKLTCQRGGRTVVSGIDFGIGAGRSLRVTGPNGSGKSTLLRVLAGLAPPESGEIRWHGEPVAEEPEAHRSRVLYVGHQDAVKPWLSPRENLAFWGRLYPGHDPRSIDTALDHFGIAKAADLPARFLSAGQRRRLSLSRLGVVPATIWLLDEPSTALDADGTRALEAAIEAHCQVDGIVVAATHTALALPRATDLDLARV